MTEDPYTSRHSQRLMDELRGWKSPAFEQFRISPWLAMSLLQKGIRRGRGDLALRAAATLLDCSPGKLWRRLNVIAFEDIGVADLDTISLVMAALSGKRFRSKIGGEWAVASYLVSRLSAAVKCRAADDLAIAADWHPTFEAFRNDYAELPTEALTGILAGQGALPERAIAMWYLIGTERCGADHLQSRAGLGRAIFDTCRKLQFPPEAISTAEEGFRRSSALLCPLTVLLAADTPSEAPDAAPDELPEEVWIGDIPGWAYDMHVREAKKAFSAFLRTEAHTAKWVRALVPPRMQLRFFGGILFRVESGLVDRRLNWPPAEALRHMVDTQCSDLPGEEVSEALALLRHDIPKLNEVRRDVLAN